MAVVVLLPEKPGTTSGLLEDVGLSVAAVVG